MIHKYNIDELNLPDRRIKAPPGFKNEDTSLPKGLWQTQNSNVFGQGQKLDAEGEKDRFKYTQKI